MTPDRFDRVHEAFKQLDLGVSRLDILSRDLNVVGLHTLAERVQDAKELTEDALETLREADAEEFNEQFQQTQLSSVAIVQAALAGIALKKQEDDNE